MTFEEALQASSVGIAVYDGIEGHMFVQIIKQNVIGQNIVEVQMSGIDHMTPEEASGLAQQLRIPTDRGWKPEGGS